MIPASELISFALAYANTRRFFAPLNINSTLSHLLFDGVVIFFNIIFYSIDSDYKYVMNKVDKYLDLWRKQREELGVDIVFAPSPKEMYGEGHILSNDFLKCQRFFVLFRFFGK